MPSETKKKLIFVYFVFYVSLIMKNTQTAGSSCHVASRKDSDQKTNVLVTFVAHIKCLFGGAIEFFLFIFFGIFLQHLHISFNNNPFTIVYDKHKMACVVFIAPTEDMLLLFNKQPLHESSIAQTAVQIPLCAERSIFFFENK